MSESRRDLVVVVRSLSAAPTAVAEANALLCFQRRHVQVPDEVLGVWCRRQLDAGLPAYLGDGVVGLREASALSGAWALCWVQGDALRDAADAQQRRGVLLRELVTPRPGLRAVDEPGAFFPVFQAGEAPQTCAGWLHSLQREHPQVVADDWFLDHGPQGLAPGSGGPPQPARPGLFRRVGPLSHRRL